MRRRSLALGVIPALSLVALGFGACSREPARIGLVMRTPLGLIDEATSVDLTVFPAELAACAPNGHVSAIPNDDAAQRFRLDRCEDGRAWCKEITLEQDGAEKMFAVVAARSGVTLAEGCAVAKIDQDPLEVAIKIQRYNPPACCNDGMLQAGEQCDPADGAAASCHDGPAGLCQGIAADAVCGCDCTANEILLSVDDTGQPGLTNAPPRSKAQLSLAFSPGSFDEENALRAVYRNESANKATKSDIAIRTLSRDLYPILDVKSAAGPQLLPASCAEPGGKGPPQAQTSPSIAAVGDAHMVVAYASDELVPNNFDVWLVAHTTRGCAEDTECAADDEACNARKTPKLLSVRAKAPGSIDPDVAGGPDGAALVTWTRGGRVLGRIWRADNTLLPAGKELELAAVGKHGRVAGGPEGWLVVYQGAGEGDGDGIFKRAVAPDGTVGEAARVNARVDGSQDQPDIAALADGRAIVVWRGAGDIYFQRYDAAGAEVLGDQEAPLNTTLDGDQASPAVAASIGYGDFYAVVWENVDKGTIAGRFAHASDGYLYNSVTGQNGDFVASHPAIAGDRRLPTVAIGGGGYVAIGWQDDSDDHPGVYVRRFPLPSTR